MMNTNRKKSKFSAQQVLEDQPTQAEGLLVSTRREGAKGGRPPLKLIERRKGHKYYMSDREWDQFKGWCNGEEPSEVVRRLVKRLLTKYETYDHM